MKTRSGEKTSYILSFFHSKQENKLVKTFPINVKGISPLWPTALYWSFLFLYHWRVVGGGEEAKRERELADFILWASICKVYLHDLER